MKRRQKSYHIIAFSLISVFMLYRIWVSLLHPVPHFFMDFKDDAFYYFKIAQNIIDTGWSTFDGIHFTNGYHPLWMLCLLPIFSLFSEDIVTPLYIIQVIQLLLFIPFAYLVYRMANHLGRARAGLFAVLLLFLPRFHAVYFDGLETILFLLLLAIIYHQMMMMEDIRDFFRDDTRKWLFGLLTALLILSRLDTIFFAFAFLGILLLQWWRMRNEIDLNPMRVFYPLILPSIVLVGGFLLYNRVVSGNFMPISGIVKNSFPLPVPRPSYLIFYKEFTYLAVYAGIILAVYLYQVFYGKFNGWSDSKRRVFEASIAVAAGYLSTVVWTVLFMTWGVYDWHFAAGIVLLIPLSAHIIHIIEHTGERVIRGGWRRIVSYFVMVVVLFFTVRLMYMRHTLKTRAFYYYTYKAALWVEENTPEEARLGMTDCGIFGYFCRRPTLNLDGVVNDLSLQEYLKRGELVQYLRDNSVDYLVEFKMRGKLYHQEYYDNYKFEIWSGYYRVSGGAMYFSRDDEIYRTPLEIFNPRRGFSIIVFKLPWGREPIDI